ncbi:MAG: rhodanese-like domain-containing protein [Haloarculaceae archaeon]
MTVGEIDSDELAALLDAEAPLRIVDVRPAGHFARGHLPGSQNLPLPELPRRVAELADAERVVTVCPHGHDSLRAARLIDSFDGIDADVPVESLAGGLTAWEGELVAGGDGGGAGQGETDGESDGPAAPF